MSMPQMYPLPYMMMHLYIIMLMMTLMTYIYFLMHFKLPSKSNHSMINFKW